MLSVINYNYVNIVFTLNKAFKIKKIKMCFQILKLLFFINKVVKENNRSKFRKEKSNTMYVAGV